ncbi:hypothetical protein [Stackebrandtia soli]|uniref:hypothetical protein n=1 Tax=Stackebrandtia soli TaxID=1892856 RepID=UPI0039ED25CF
MRSQDDDVATLTKWAAEDRRHLIVGTSIAPFTPFAWWWLFSEGSDGMNWCLDIVCGFVIAFATFYGLVGLSELAPGPGAPQRILDGAESSVACSAVVHCDDADRPYPISVALCLPRSDDRYRYVHLSDSTGLVAGERLTAYGWGTVDKPFKKGMLLVTGAGRRLWTREGPAVSERYEHDTGG